MDLSNNEEAFGIKRQSIVFVRHGIARHNLLDDKGNPPNLNNPELFDPPLVLEGKKQAFDAGERLRIWWHTTQVGEHLELVITSPLTRCLQTTALAFLPGDRYAARAMASRQLALRDNPHRIRTHACGFGDSNRQQSHLRNDSIANMGQQVSASKAGS
jgi:hypothetical protein